MPLARSPHLPLRLLCLLLTMTSATLVPIVFPQPALTQQATAAERLAEADRLNDQGIQQVQTSQYREVLSA